MIKNWMICLTVEYLANSGNAILCIKHRKLFIVIVDDAKR